MKGKKSTVKNNKGEADSKTKIDIISEKEMKEMLDDEYFLARAILEIVGKPKEHIETSLHDYISKISKESKFFLVESNIEEALEVESDKDMYSTFAEIEFLTKDLTDLMGFVIDYMPSSIEVVQPAGMSVQASFLSNMLTELAGKLHLIDGVLKKTNAENQLMSKSLGIMIQNSILILLNLGPRTIEKIGEAIGVQKDQCEVFLKKLLDDDKIIFDDETKKYLLKSKE